MSHPSPVGRKRHSRPLCGMPSRPGSGALTMQEHTPSAARLCPNSAPQPTRSICDPPPVHVRIRHRRTPGQDRRSDQRLHSRCAARPGLQEPCRRRDAHHDRPGSRRGRGYDRGICGHPGDRPGTHSGHRLRLFPEGLRRAVVRGQRLDRGPVTGHRAGRRRRLRGSGRGFRRRGCRSGRGGPGPHVRLRLRRHA